VWEHQALSRARYCAGDPAIGAAFEAVRERVLALPRDAESLAREIVEMRAKVLNGHPNRTALFDLKHDRGGMVDIEFMVQYLILLHAPVHAELIRNTGNIGLLRQLARLGLITEQDAAVVGDAYRTYRALQHKMRLDGLDAARVAPERVASERTVVLALWQRLFGS
jgi:glutamate-ammonia-ligase adenylyltransferase